MPQSYTKSKGTRRGKAQFQPDPDKFLFNIDTLYLNIDSYYYEQVMLETGLSDMLLEGRDYYSDWGQALKLPVIVPGYENPIEFDISFGQAPMYQYSLRNDSMAIYFAKSYREDAFPIKVQLNQFLLWERGVEKAYHESLNVLKALGFVPYKSKLNRCDFACHSDQFQWNYHDIKKLDYPRNIAKDNYPNVIKLNPDTMDFETLTHGDRKRCYLRIYNKSKEIKKKQKYYFYDIYNAKGMDTEKVWNVEIECNRPFLKDLMGEIEDEYKNIFDDFDECLKVNGLSRLWSLLMERYTHDSAFWRVLEKGDQNHFNQIEQYDLQIDKDISANAEREIAQIKGRLITLVMNKENYTLHDAIREFYDSVTEREENGEVIPFTELVKNKKAFMLQHDINRQIKTYAAKNRKKCPTFSEEKDEH